MNAITAKKIGRKQSVFVCGVAILFIEIIHFITEIKGDFANGLLFFIEKYFNLFSLIIIGFFLTIYMVIGGYTALEILLKNKNYLIVSIRNAVITFISYCILLIIINVFAKGDLSDVPIFLDKNIRNELVFSGSIFLILITIIWVIIAFRIKKLKVENNLL